MGRLGKRLKSLGEEFENLMSAATFAEVGEYAMAMQMSKGGNVLLVLRDVESEKKSLKFAINIAKRIGAGLEVLYVCAQNGITELLKSIEQVAEKEGIVFKMQRASGCIKEEIFNYTKKRADIKFVVIESTDMLNLDCDQEKWLKRNWKDLKCPLVVVS